MKEAKCTICGKKHYQTFCPRKAKKPIKARTKPSKPIKPKKPTTKPKPKKKLTRKQLVAKLDKVFSTYIRQSAAKNGYTVCVTCGDKDLWQNHQNGHFFTRGRYPTRWDETNCHVQCVRCNIFLKGNYIQYTLYMVDRYGREAVDDLEKKSKLSTKITSVELQELIEKYKNLTKSA